MNQIKIDEKWVAWVQENLTRGTSVKAIVDILGANFKISEANARQTIEQIRKLPIKSKVSGEAQGQLERREWMMKTLDAVARVSKTPYAIPQMSPPSFADFIEHFYSQNKPVRLLDAFASWPAKNWTPDNLLAVAGDQVVEVQFDREANKTFEMDSLKHKKAMPFSEYHALVQSCGQSNDFYMTANNAEKNQSVMQPLFNDVLNFADGYFDESRHSERSFIWYGPKGNYTPLHHDQTNNMFLQVYGRKRFLLVPPNQTPYLYNERAVFSPLDLRNIDVKTHPLAKNVTPLEVILNPGDTLFIPVGWWHQVESLDISISITMTNFKVNNSFNF